VPCPTHQLRQSRPYSSAIAAMIRSGATSCKVTWRRRQRTAISKRGTTDGSTPAWTGRRRSTALWKCAAFILLVSRYSLASRFILDEEVKAALEAHWTRGVQIYPIVVTACDIRAVPWLARMNLRPRDAKPLALYPPARRDEVMATLAAEIRRIIENASAPNALAP
jgi:hypothetical protein